METTQHAGHKRSTKPPGEMAQKMNEFLFALNRIPASSRSQVWHDVNAMTREALSLLNEGRRAKSGKVFAQAKRLAATAETHTAGTQA